MARNEARVTGWWVFAAALLLLAGVLNIIWGIAAIGDAKFFIADQKYIISSLHTWGWITLILGVLPDVCSLLAGLRRRLRALVRHVRRRPERHLGAAVDPRLPVLVTVHLRPGHHHPLRVGQGPRRRHDGVTPRACRQREGSATRGAFVLSVSAAHVLRSLLG